MDEHVKGVISDPNVNTRAATCQIDLQKTFMSVRFVASEEKTAHISYWAFHCHNGNA